VQHEIQFPHQRTRHDLQQHKFHVFDVGGQQNELKEWNNCLKNVHTVIFVASIASYDMVTKFHISRSRVDRLRFM
jgi:hypothetical protein